MMKRKKPSLAFIFSALCLLTIVVSIVIISVVSFVNLRRISYAQVEALTKENTLRVRDSVMAMLDRHEDLLEETAVGVASLLHVGTGEHDDMHRYLNQTAAILPDVSFLYYTSNIRWTEQGGYAVFTPDWMPPEDWDNTQRPWFILAKQAQGGIAYTDPYVDPATGKLVLALSKTMFDARGQDIGIVSEEITADFLGIWSMPRPLSRNSKPF